MGMIKTAVPNPEFGSIDSGFRKGFWGQCYETSLSLMWSTNKLECTFQKSIIFAGKIRAYLGWLLTLLKIIIAIVNMASKGKTH
jgi:hypothetical protein